ncbi:DUF6610 family protein [Geminocystis sp. NIES-3709]|uniref:DUF6610 family protein n=1 Tax=Geminocystis sp. NIES-3709 TaxID=1617448 RepID=UPI0005FC6174|nr:DUF6610 family protein [Geminocystis sp. NIES-3709]BAQ65585.1 hypothetical protein GM3709_2350 [Geminocystis sp. NIES-3709]
MIKILINGGGSSLYDKIAHNYGWQIGMNSGGNTKEKQPLFMIDNNWLNYDHEKHLNLIKKHRPHLATLRDIESYIDQQILYKQALEISRYCDRLIIIPKCNITNDKLLKIPNSILGLPVGPHENLFAWEYAKVLNKKIHLLGGSPKKWKNAIEILGEKKIYSMDGNYLCKLSKWGKIYLNFSTRKPYSFEVSNGKNFNYRCFEFSIKNLEFKPMNKQLSLF